MKSSDFLRALFALHRRVRSAAIPSTATASSPLKPTIQQSLDRISLVALALRLAESRTTMSQQYASLLMESYRAMRNHPSQSSPAATSAMMMEAFARILPHAKGQMQLDLQELLVEMKRASAGSILNFYWPARHYKWLDPAQELSETVLSDLERFTEKELRSSANIPTLLPRLNVRFPSIQNLLRALPRNTELRQAYSLLSLIRTDHPRYIWNAQMDFSAFVSRRSGDDEKQLAQSLAFLYQNRLPIPPEFYPKLVQTTNEHRRSLAMNYAKMDVTIARILDHQKPTSLQPFLDPSAMHSALLERNILRLPWNGAVSKVSLSLLNRYLKAKDFYRTSAWISVLAGHAPSRWFVFQLDFHNVWQRIYDLYVEETVSCGAIPILQDRFLFQQLSSRHPMDPTRLGNKAIQQALKENRIPNVARLLADARIQRLTSKTISLLLPNSSPILRQPSVFDAIARLPAKFLPWSPLLSETVEYLVSNKRFEDARALLKGTREFPAIDKLLFTVQLDPNMEQVQGFLDLHRLLPFEQKQLYESAIRAFLLRGDAKEVLLGIKSAAKDGHSLPANIFSEAADLLTRELGEKGLLALERVASEQRALSSAKLRDGYIKAVYRCKIHESWLNLFYRSLDKRPDRLTVSAFSNAILLEKQRLKKLELFQTFLFSPEQLDVDSAARVLKGLARSDTPTGLDFWHQLEAVNYLNRCRETPIPEIPWTFNVNMMESAMVLFREMREPRRMLALAEEYPEQAGSRRFHLSLIHHTAYGGFPEECGEAFQQYIGFLNPSHPVQAVEEEGSFEELAVNRFSYRLPERSAYRDLVLAYGRAGQIKTALKYYTGWRRRIPEMHSYFPEIQECFELDRTSVATATKLVQLATGRYHRLRHHWKRRVPVETIRANRKPSVKVFNTQLWAYARRGDAYRVERILRLMQRKYDLRPDSLSITAWMQALIAKDEPEKVLRMYLEVIRDSGRRSLLTLLKASQAAFRKDRGCAECALHVISDALRDAAEIQKWPGWERKMVAGVDDLSTLVWRDCLTAEDLNAFRKHVEELEECVGKGDGQSVLNMMK